MRNLLFILFCSLSGFVWSQDVNMQNGLVNRCGGVFYDSGGEFGNYGDDENFVLTICPENPGQRVRLDFTAFSIQLNLDFMTIYNGDSTAAPVFGQFTGGNSPGAVEATLANTSGCITIEFTSSPSGNVGGWAADISCLTPCQVINAQLDSATPTPNGDGYIRVCPNEDITLTGSGTFSVDGTGATYEWDLGDGNTASGQTVTFSYPTPGVYIVNLNIRDTNTSQDPLGCANNNLINQVVQVATAPDFTGTQAASPVICYGDSTDLTGVVQPTPFINDCTPPVADQTFLPDGNGVSYVSEIPVDCFDSAATITDPNQIISICLNIEHSFLGDLEITIISPNGQQAILKDFPGGGGTYLGGANDDGSNTPGVGADYCFSMTGTQTLVNGPTITAGSPPNQSIAPGTYLPEQSFSNLVGSPLNGDWTIRVTDNLGIDNGYIFSWEIEFDPNLQPPELSFTPAITTEAWDTDPTITNTAGNVITVTPPDAGQYCYTYRVTDDFGCEYTEEVCIDVLPEIVTVPPNDLVTCDTGAPPYIYDLESNTAVVTSNAPNPGELVVSYHNTQADAENDTSALVNVNSYSGTNGEIIYVRIEYLNSGCFEVFPFTLLVTGQPVINPVTDLIVCDDPSNDGFEEFDLSLQTAGVLGTQSDTAFNVTYHLSFADADAGTGVLPTLYTNTSNPELIYVRIESAGDSNCYNASPNPVFSLIVEPREDASFTASPTCDGAVMAVTGVSGGSFAFNPVPSDGALIDPVTGLVTSGGSGQTYTVEYTTPGTCASVNTETFTVIPVDDPGFNVDPTCDGATVSITGDTGGVFTFNPPPVDTAVIDGATGTVTNATPGASYTIVYTTSGPCPDSSTETFTVLTLDDPSFTLTPTCDGATATLTGDPGGTFAFNPIPADTAVIDAATGTITGGVSNTTYTVEYTTAGNCPQSQLQDVTVLTSDDPGFTMTSTCDGGTANITGTPGGVFAFDVPPSDAAVIDPVTGTVSNGSPGTSYTVVYTTTGVCPQSLVVNFNVLPIDDPSFVVAPTCDGGTVTVIGDPGGVFAFAVPPADTAIINPVTGNVTNGTPGETYIIQYTTTGICPNSSSVNFTANPLPQFVVPTALEVCDDGVPDGITSIDLTLKDSEISGGNTSYVVTYYETQADADLAQNALPIPYTNTVNNQIVVVRIEDSNTGCYDTTTLELVVQQAPIAFAPQPLLYCDPDNDGFGFFDLTAADAEITGGDPTLAVTYHETQVNAESGVNAIDTSVLYENITEDTQRVYARIENPNIATNCYVIEALDLIVEPTPQIEDPQALEFCDDLTPDGRIVFDLTVRAADILNGLDPLQYVLSYYETQADAEAATAAIGLPTAYTNTTPVNQVVWVRVEDTTTAGGCYKLTSLELIVNPLPVAIQPTPLELCDDLGEVPGDAFTAFDLTVKDVEITGGNASWTVTYYETQADADAGTAAIADPTSYTNRSVGGLPSNPQTLFAVVTDIDTGCTDQVTLTIRVLPNPTPTPSDQLPDLILCDDTNTGDGVEPFDLRTNELLILNGETGVTVTYYETAEDADSATDAIVDPTAYVNTQTPEQTIYVRVTDDVTGCYALVDFDLQVNPLPEVVAVTDFIQCELNTDGFASFDLSTKDEEVLGGQNPVDYAVSYHVTLADAESLTNAIQGPYINVSNPQEIYVAITNTITGCSISTQRFSIEVQEAAQANPDMTAIVYALCDDQMETDGDPTDDSVQFDLSTQDGDVLDGQDPSNYIVRYYSTEADALLGVNPLPVLYENVINPQVIYARVDNDTPDGTGQDSSICFAITPLTLQVDPLPEFDLEERYTLCVNADGTEVIAPPVLDTGLSELDYSFEWRFEGNVIAGATGSSYMPDQGGNYSVLVTDLTTGCVNEDSTVVEESGPPTLEVSVVSEAFDSSNVIEAIATGDGVYEYSLDGGPWQASGVFTDVSPGLHEVSVRDILGCGEASAEVMVLDYPRFFTPNGDGRNDTWNIIGIDNQSNAKIYIFDRYGKLLKQLSPQGSGWDGTYNGNRMPSSDYWFTLTYNEPLTGAPKEFRAHFTLKR